MITSLQLVNFKNFANEKLRVGPFTVIVGANASGKSNISTLSESFTASAKQCLEDFDALARCMEAID